MRSCLRGALLPPKRGRVDFKSCCFDDRLQPFRFGARQNSKLLVFDSEKYVFRDSQFGYEMKFLVHDRDAAV